MMAFALPVWLAVQEELLGLGEADSGAPCPFDEFDDETLFQLFHLTRPCITFIADAVRTRLQTADPKKPSLTGDEMLMLALNYYAHGVSSPAIRQRADLAHADFPSVITTVSGAVAEMTDQFVSFPLDRDAAASVASKTERLCGIPNVLGVLSSAHFRIRPSPYEKESFRSFVNTLGYTSVVSQLICDSDGNILSVEECSAGSAFEQEMWESSSRGREIEEGVHGPYWVIGGNGYRLSKHVLTPVPEPANDSETRFNEAHEKIHSVTRTTLDIMQRRFRCLMQLGFAQDGELYKKSNIIKACIVLHNIAKKFSVPPPPIAGQIEPMHPARPRAVPQEVDPEAIKARQELINTNFSIAPSIIQPQTKDSQGEGI